MTPAPDLRAAYALTGPEAVRRLYADWAGSYDADFAAGMDYILPAAVARAFVEAGGTGPVLDAGAGTGLLGAALRGLGLAGAIDGIDLSAAMLARARATGAYRHLRVADLTQPLPPGGRWGGIVSSGTFTHGHLGPDALAHLLAMASPGAVVALSVNAGVWDAQGWPAALARLPLTGLAVAEAPIYGPALRDPAHAADRARIVTARRA